MPLYYADDFDAEEQVEAEEMIAATIFDALWGEEDSEGEPYIGGSGSGFEELCGDLGRTILRRTLLRFRPDMFIEAEEEDAAF